MTPSRPRCIKRAPNINEFLPLRNDASSVDCFGQLNLGFQVLVDSVSANTLNQNLQILRNPVVRLGMKWLISHVSDIKKYLQRYGRTLILSVWRIRLHPAIPSPATNIAKTARVEIAPVVCCFDISNVTSVSSPFDSVACVTFELQVRR